MNSPVSLQAATPKASPTARTLRPPIRTGIFHVGKRVMDCSFRLWCPALFLPVLFVDAIGI
jgi:hypothetical protein